MRFFYRNKSGLPLLRNKRLGNAGRKGLDFVKYVEALREIAIKNRTTIRSLAAALELPRSTLYLHDDEDVPTRKVQHSCYAPPAAVQ